PTRNFGYAPGPVAGPTWALEFHRPWIVRFGIDVHPGLEGLWLLMILLTGLLGVLSVLCSLKENQRKVGFFHLNLMWSLGGVAVVFLTIELFIIFFFWELILVSMYFRISLCGHSSPDGTQARIDAATRFYILSHASRISNLLP
ncbi:NADH-quinone oxidoreductase subunit M, partial [Pseudomonas syringae]